MTFEAGQKVAFEDPDVGQIVGTFVRLLPRDVAEVRHPTDETAAGGIHQYTSRVPLIDLVPWPAASFTPETETLK